MVTNSTPPVDRDFIRRAVELADLNAVRVALYQHTHDPEIAALPKALLMEPEDRELLIGKATDWLVEHAGPVTVEEPPVDELRVLMNLATKEEMNDLDFEARRELPAFKEFPFFTEWGEHRAEVPADFLVAIIGSGFSGLAMAVQCERLGLPYVILERRTEPGGTWTINRYPDVRVDTISITYEFSFEKEHRWKEYFGRGSEVRSYLDMVSKKYGPYQHTRFGCDVRTGTFDRERNRWTLEIDTPDGPDTLEASVVVNAVGVFANPNFPKFDGMDTFEGDVIHPSRWPEDADLAGKRVGIVGNGSTGVQLLAPIAREAEQVYVFQRTPQWISPREKYGQPVEPEVLWLIDNFPAYWNWWRYMAIAALFQTHGFVQPDPEWVAKGGRWNAMNDKLREDLTAYIHAQVGDRPDLIEKLIPDYAPFSRRPVVDNGWYKSLTRDNVELVTDPITRLNPKGVETADGEVREIDVLVTATGFEVARFLWPAHWYGVDGVDIHDKWSTDGARAYLSMMVPGYPNMFMLYGPNSQPLSGGTGLPIWYVVWSSYAAKCIMRMLDAGASRVDVKDEAYERYNEALDAEASSLLLLQDEGAPDKNYYVNEFRRLQVNAPWYGPEFHRMCTNVDWDDIVIS